MYSLVMMTALTTAPSGPEFNGYFRNLFRGGCTGQSQSSSSCAGSCNGGIFHGRIVSFFSFGGGSCSGSCAGKSAANASCGGCTGKSLSCNGCTGSLPSYSCAGSLAPSYSCGGGLVPGYPMEFGSPYATPMPAYYGSAIPMVPSIPILDPVPQPFRPDTNVGHKSILPSPTITAAQRATVVIRLPSDARLYVDGHLLELASAERTFVTPELPVGREYAYSFKIEYDRNGRTLGESQKVSVAAGKTSTLVFDDLTAAAKPKAEGTAVTAKPIEPTKPVSAEKPKADESINPFRSNSYVSNPAPARITVKLPENATLYIDGKKNEKAGKLREFTTPPLPFGKEFSYSLKLEKNRNGQPEELLQKVVFQAGETVTVDFTDPTAERNAGK